MIKALCKKSDARKYGLAAQIADKDAEIADLKAEVARQHARNDELCIENRQLNIRNSELNAAYACLSEILRNRGVTAEMQYKTDRKEEARTIYRT